MDGEPDKWDVHWRTLRGGAKDMTKHPQQQAYFQQLVRDAAPVAMRNFVELGCGRGTLSRLLARQGAPVCVQDANVSAIELARDGISRDGGAVAVRSLIGDCRYTGLPTESFQVCFSSGLLEHFADPLPVLNESVRLASYLAWHLVVPKDRGNDRWYRNDYGPEWYAEHGFQCLRHFAWGPFVVARYAEGEQ